MEVEVPHGRRISRRMAPLKSLSGQAGGSAGAGGTRVIPMRPIAHGTKTSKGAEKTVGSYTKRKILTGSNTIIMMAESEG